MADKLYSAYGQITQRYADMGIGTDGFQSYALVTAPQQGNVASGAADSGNPVKVGGRYNAVLPVYTDGQRGDLQISARGSMRALVQFNGGVGSDAWSNASVGFVGNDSSPTNGILPVGGSYVYNGTSWDRMVKPNLTSRLISSAATTNATSVKASAGNLHRIRGENTAAAKKYLKFYNKASAPVVGTDTPVLTFVLPVTAPFDIDMSTMGQYFSAGIAYAITGAAADADTTALAAGDVQAMNITYS